MSANPSPPVAPAGSNRLLSLDVFRGVTIASMMLVNNPGSWSAAYPPLLHAEWHGWTFTDTVFPFFLWIVGVAVVLRLVVSAAAAYSLSHLKPFGAKWVTTGLLLTLMVPGMAYFVPLYVTISDIPIIHVNLLNSYWGLWLPYCVDAFGIFVLKTFFDNIPTEIIDSAKVDGASAWQTFLNIVLPLSRSIMIVLAVVSFVGIWKDYLLPMLVITDPSMQPITVRLFTLMDNNYGVNLQMAASFIALLPPLIIALVMQRYMTMGLTIGGVKG